MASERTAQIETLPPHIRRVAVIAILALAGAVAFHNLTVPALWNDEGFSYFVSVGGIRNTVYWLLNDTHPPLYYMALAQWLDFGHGVFALRSLSGVAMIIATGFVYLAARALFGGRVALLATLLFAVTPGCVNWAQKARPYALQTMFVAIAFWGWVKVFLAPEAREHLLGTGVAAAIRQRRCAPAATDLAWLAYAVAGGLAMLVQHPAGFFVLGCNCAMACVIFRDIRRTWRLLVNWIIAQLVLIAIWLAWLPEFLVQVAAQLTPDQIATKHPIFLLEPAGMASIVVGLLGVSDLWRIQLPVFAFIIAIAAWGVFMLIRTRSGKGSVFLTVLIPIVVCTIGFAVLHPIFGYVMTTFAWIHVPYVVLIAYGIAAIGFRPLRCIVLALAVLVHLWGLRNYYAESPPALDMVAQVIAQDAAPGDGIIYSQESSGRFGIAYYLQSRHIDMPGLDATRDAKGLIRTAAAASANQRNWVVLPAGETPAVPLAALGKPGLQRRIGDLTVLRFARGG